MDIKPIKTNADYRAVLKEIESLMMARANTPEGERLDVLATLVEAYERKHMFDQTFATASTGSLSMVGLVLPCRGNG